MYTGRPLGVHVPTLPGRFRTAGDRIRTCASERLCLMPFSTVAKICSLAAGVGTPTCRSSFA
eukprot:382798-Prorocentrum_minimum.AAC.1